jgi:hypothetical protein
LRRKATNRIALAGTLLVSEDAYDRREVDLARTVCQVKLAGGTKVNYLPVLQIQRDADDTWPLEVHLADPDSGALRSPDDMLRLANALERTDSRESWDAAGRLRTLATWKSLPTIYGADPDAIPITPPGGSPARPTPVDAGMPSPEIALPPRPPIRPVRRAVADALLVMAAWVLLLLSFTVGTVTNLDDAFEGRSREGVARATECVKYGPVSRSGFGYWYRCRAEVTWRDGKRQSRSTRGSILTPDDIGRQVQVRETPRTRRHRGYLYRVDDPPRLWGVFAFFPLFMSGLIFLLRPVVDLFRLGRWLAKRRPAARA